MARTAAGSAGELFVGRAQCVASCCFFELLPQASDLCLLSLYVVDLSSGPTKPTASFRVALPAEPQTRWQRRSVGNEATSNRFDGSVFVGLGGRMGGGVRARCIAST